MSKQINLHPKLLPFFFELQQEWHSSTGKYGHGRSIEEIMFVIREEYLELEKEIMEKPENRSPERIMTEAKQLANTALKIYLYAQSMDAK